ncbi:MAG: NgoFVII family restriction endonuclease [Sphingobacteriales bacterium]|nr:MAG: NgoFVII family restriction endonuclease [Sphingobacteriales bacterium]
MPVSIITNNHQNHKQLLLQLLSDADEIIFAVGFLKSSGIKNLLSPLAEFCNNPHNKATFFIGSGLGETHPDALWSLYETLQGNEANKLILCTPDAGIFHPKIYVFIKGTVANVVIGSSNLTQHGWVINDEVSVWYQSSTTDTEFIQLSSYFSQLLTSYQAEDIRQELEAYEEQLAEFQDANGVRSVFRFRTQTNRSVIDLARLAVYYSQYRQSEEFISPADREAKYGLALQKLEELADVKHLTKQEFHDLFGPLVGHKGYAKLWHSGSIHRKTYKTLDYADSFRKLIRFAITNVDQPVSVVFDSCLRFLKQMKKAKQISGVGENILTEILLTLNPKKFANLNDNPLAVLEMLGVLFPSGTSFTGQTYDQYIQLLSQVREHLGLNSFLEIDSFFNYVYWNLLEELS